MRISDWSSDVCSSDLVMLTDWTDEDPSRVMAKLKKQSDYYNHHKRTVGDFIDDVSKQGWSAAVADRKMWAEMKMNPRSEEHTSELQALMRNSYAVFCVKKNMQNRKSTQMNTNH